MGIAGFASRMQDYGTFKPISQSPGATSRTYAVIDGPALAHFAFQELLKEESGGTHTLGLLCKYSDITQVATSWLNRLEHFGFYIEAIYFDGALPSYKIPTRKERLQVQLSNLLKYQILFEAHVHHFSGKQSRSIRNVNSGDLKNARKRLSPPPFMVTAVIESLQASQFRDRTFVVPGEADTFCAAAALRLAQRDPTQAVTIFTNDSDLIVYESGPQTRVVLINSMEEIKQDDGEKALHGLEHWPAALARSGKFPLKDLIKPAFVMLDKHVTFKQALAATHSDGQDRALIAFAKEFSTADAAVELEALESQRGRGKAHILVEPRVSEVIVASASALEKEGLKLFLPVLFEDPSRSSAWKIGRPFRSLALSILLDHRQLDCAVVEYRRSGAELRPFQMTPQSSEMNCQALETWTAYFDEQMQQTAHFGSRAIQWVLLTVQLVVSELFHEGSRLPTASDATAAACSKRTSSWSVTHFCAHLQAAYYSLRMLVQMLMFIEQEERDNGEVEYKSVTKAANDFLRIMKDFPSVSVFFEGVNENQEDKVEHFIEGYLDDLRALNGS